MVEVEYSVQDGANILHELETHVPSGAGVNDAVGKIESMGDIVTIDVYIVVTLCSPRGHLRHLFLWYSLKVPNYPGK